MFHQLNILLWILVIIIIPLTISIEGPGLRRVLHLFLRLSTPWFAFSTTPPPALTSHRHIRWHSRDHFMGGMGMWWVQRYWLTLHSLKSWSTSGNRSQPTLSSSLPPTWSVSIHPVHNLHCFSPDSWPLRLACSSTTWQRRASDEHFLTLATVLRPGSRWRMRMKNWRGAFLFWLLKVNHANADHHQVAAVSVAPARGCWDEGRHNVPSWGELARPGNNISANNSFSQNHGYKDVKPMLSISIMMMITGEVTACGSMTFG